MNGNIGWLIVETASVSEPSGNIISVKNNRVELEACLQDLNKKNRNGRYYEDKQLVPQLTCPRITELVSTGNLFSESGHPNDGSLSRQQTIDPNNRAARINKLWVDGNKIVANVTAAESRVGDDFHRMVLGGTKVSFSLRALGTVENTARGAEVKNIKIVTWDVVHYPSHAAAYQTSILNMNESAKLKGNSFILSESGSGLFVPINNEKVTSYIKEQSSNLRAVVESFEFLYKDIVLSENGKTVRLTGNDGNTLIVRVEEHISNEIMNYCNTKY